MYQLDSIDNRLAYYTSLITRRMSQETEKVRFGSEAEASALGSSATFRLSDSPDYVSQIMAEHPVSFVSRYPEFTDQLRDTHGLDPIFGDDPPIIPGMPNDQGTNNTPPMLQGLGQYIPGAGLVDWFNANLFNFQVFTFAIVLVIIGGIMIALSTDTGKAIAKDAVKAAAA